MRIKRKTLIPGLISLLLLLIASSIIILIINGPKQNTNIPKPARTNTSVITTTTPTPDPSLTPIPTPFFFDNFIDNSKAWSVSRENDTSGYQRQVINDQLILKDTNHQTLIETLPSGAVYDDFVLNATFTFLDGDKNDSIGFYLRGNVRLDSDYRIDIYGDNSFSITKEFLNPAEKPQIMTLKEPTIFPHLKPRGEANTFTAMMRGPYLLVLLNGHVAASLVDADYTAGQIALFARNGATSNGVIVAFDEIEIKPVPQLPETETPTATATTQP